ncbi:MAG: GTPase HflX [Verrucomicrobiota bacterium]
MFDIHEKPKMVERALLIGIYQKGEDPDLAQDLLSELEELVDTMGVPVFAKELVQIRQPQARYLMGKGKAEEMIDIVRDLNLDVIIFDNVLTPAQQRNWEALHSVCVIDRQEVILDIFSNRAQTKEARLQVELARLQYNLPRLTRAWSHLGQQGGGIGTKGEGETQLELDKRMIRSRITQVQKELAAVRLRRATQRKERQRVPVPNAAIVGYTNAGKSSLLTALTKADILVENKLFATLDTTTRKIALPNQQPLLLTDTVGFVRRLPHQLIEAFKSTLEEATIANFLIHLLDASQPQVYQFHRTTLDVLEELGARGKKTITVFNKVDKLSDPSIIASLKLHFPDAIFISLKSGQGLFELEHLLCQLVEEESLNLHLEIPHARADLIARLYREANVLHIEYRDAITTVVASVPAKIVPHFEQFAKESDKTVEINTRASR